jgi:hypothetical protein
MIAAFLSSEVPREGTMTAPTGKGRTSDDAFQTVRNSTDYTHDTFAYAGEYAGEAGDNASHLCTGEKDVKLRVHWCETITSFICFDPSPLERSHRSCATSTVPIRAPQRARTHIKAN